MTKESTKNRMAEEECNRTARIWKPETEAEDETTARSRQATDRATRDEPILTSCAAIVSPKRAASGSPSCPKDASNTSSCRQRAASAWRDCRRTGKSAIHSLRHSRTSSRGNKVPSPASAQGGRAEVCLLWWPRRPRESRRRRHRGSAKPGWFVCLFWVGGVQKRLLMYVRSCTHAAAFPHAVLRRLSGRPSRTVPDLPLTKQGGLADVRFAQCQPEPANMGRMQASDGKAC